eukprot:scaffold3127_cov202-Prasinococcus_capsulatus_cf.AAC.14
MVLLRRPDTESITSEYAKRLEQTWVDQGMDIDSSACVHQHSHSGVVATPALTEVGARCPRVRHDASRIILRPQSLMAGGEAIGSHSLLDLLGRALYKGLTTA